MAASQISESVASSISSGSPSSSLSEQLPPSPPSPPSPAPPPWLALAPQPPHHAPQQVYEAQPSHGVAKRRRLPRPAQGEVHTCE